MGRRPGSARVNGVGGGCVVEPLKTPTVPGRATPRPWLLSSPQPSAHRHPGQPGQHGPAPARLAGWRQQLGGHSARGAARRALAVTQILHQSGAPKDAQAFLVIIHWRQQQGAHLRREGCTGWSEMGGERHGAARAGASGAGMQQAKRAGNKLQARGTNGQKPQLCCSTEWRTQCGRELRRMDGGISVRQVLPLAHSYLRAAGRERMRPGRHAGGRMGAACNRCGLPVVSCCVHAHAWGGWQAAHLMQRVRQAQLFNQNGGAVAAGCGRCVQVQGRWARRQRAWLCGRRAGRRAAGVGSGRRRRAGCGLLLADRASRHRQESRQLDPSTHRLARGRRVSGPACASLQAPRLPAAGQPAGVGLLVRLTTA